MKKACWIIFFAFIAVSCLDDPDCYQLKNEWVGLTFRVIGTGAADTVRLRSIIVQNKLGFEKQRDTIVTTFSFPIDYYRDNTFLYFGKADRSNFLSLNYLVQPQFVTEDCPPRFTISALNADSHNFDSVRISNPVAGTNPQSRNIEIFRCPSTPLMGIRFRQLQIGSNGTPSATELTLRSGGITADFSDKIFYENTDVNTVYLPVNLTTTGTRQSQYIFSLPASAPTEKQLTVRYNVVNEVRYHACGSQLYVGDLNVLTSSFDSVRVSTNIRGVLQNRLTDPPAVNVDVVTCPQNNLIQIVFRTQGQTGKTEKKVKLRGIRTNYTSEVFYQNSEVSSVILPLDKNALATDFYIDYEDRTETLPLRYRKPRKLFDACGSPHFINQLRERTDLPHVSILQPEVRYPAVPNVEITD